ncbi:ribonuclease P protein component 2 [Candidatus Woesearchaeota archaeon]|nr:ribonuclease P protein component 2 [Candidatus Woesearchaeota archaeon]
MIKIKGLLPSLREQNRYVLFEVISKNKLDYPSIAKTIMDNCKFYMGTVGFARAGPMFIKNKWDFEKQTGLVKVNRKYVDWLKASFALIKKIRNNDAIVRSQKVSGILRKAC